MGDVCNSIVCEVLAVRWLFFVFAAGSCLWNEVALGDEMNSDVQNSALWHCWRESPAEDFLTDAPVVGNGRSCRVLSRNRSRVNKVSSEAFESLSRDRTQSYEQAAREKEDPSANLDIRSASHLSADSKNGT